MAQQVNVPSAVSFSLATGLYTYSYSVNDATTMDLAIVNVPASQQSNLMNLIAPSGFSISFDPGVGIVSFFEDNDPNTTGTFAANSTVPGFSFTSRFGPGSVTFDALDVSGTTYNGQTMSAVVPEPATTAILAVGTLFTGGVFLRRRAAARQVSVQ